MPKTITGPATENIFAHKPSTMPSLLCSIAGLTIEFANPVIGMMLPAPPNEPILSYTPKPVRMPVMRIMLIVVNPATVFSSNAGKQY